MRIMALDIGTKRIGVALSDALKITSQPFTTIEYKSHNAAFGQIGEIIEKKEVSRVIAGLPLNKDGEFTPKTREIEGFIKKLEKFLNISIVRVDERYSSQDAEAHMRSMGKKPSKNKADIDKIAAAMILKEYLSELEITGAE